MQSTDDDGCPNTKKPRKTELDSPPPAPLPPLNQSFPDLYGYGDSINVERIAQDIDDAASDPNKVMSLFARRVDADGQTMLHYLAWEPLNEGTVPLVRRLLEIDKKLAQVVDIRNKQLPLWNYFYSLSHCTDDVRYVWYNLLENPPRAAFSLGLLLPAFPEAIFDEEVLSCLGFDRAYKSDDLFRIWNNDDSDNDDPNIGDAPTEDGVEIEQEQEASDDDDDSSDEESEGESSDPSSSETALVGLLKLAFPDGLDRIPSPDSVLETGNRAPIHILCSYAYQHVFESLFDLAFQPHMASLPDPATQNMLPLQLVLKSPVLRHPLAGGRIYGFCQMRERNRRVPVSVVQKLVDAHPPALAVPDENGCLPIHWAVRHNNLQLVRTVLQPNPSSLAVHDHQGHSPLLLACQHHCDLDLVYFLVRANPNIHEWYNTAAPFTDAVLMNQMSPPKIVPIADQSSKASYTAFQAKASEDSPPIDRWGIEVLRAWKIKATTATSKPSATGGDRTHWILLPDGSNPGDVCIDHRTGRITYSGRYTKDVILQVRVTAENVVGWSSVEFEIEFPGEGGT